MKYIVAYRKKCTDKDTLEPNEFSIGRNAESYAIMMFNRFQMDRVKVIQVDGDTEECETSYLQENNCKHNNIQQEFDLRVGSIRNRCIDCGELIVEFTVKGAECIQLS